MEKELPISIHVHIRKEDCFLPDDTQVDFEDIIGERKLSLIAISEEYDLYKYTYTCDDSRIGNDNRYGICSKNRIPITPQIYRDVYYRNNFLIARKFGTLIDILNLQGQILFNSIKNIEEHSKYTILTNVKDETTFLNSNGCRLSQELKELKNKEYIKIFFKNDKMYYLNSLIVNSKNDTLTSVNIFKQINYEKHIFENRIDIHDCFNNSTYAYKPINETSEVYVFTIDSKYEILFSIDHIQIIPHYEKIELIPLKYYSFYKIYSNNLVGILDAKTGNELCPPIYDEIYCEEKGFKLQKDNKFGYITLEKDIVIETKYDDIYYKNNNFILKKKDKVGIITESNYIIEPQYHEIEKLSYGYYAYLENNKWGIINKQNETILEPYFEEISPLRYEDSCFLCMMKNNTWKVVDLKKKKLLEESFDYIEERRRIIYVRRGRKMCHLGAYDKGLQPFWSDNSCGYRSNILLFSFDCNLTSLLPSQND